MLVTVIAGAMIATASAIVTLAFGAGPSAAATGPQISQDRPVGSFDRIELDGAFKATITAGAEVPHVALSGSEGDLERITTEIHDGTLIVSTSGGTNWSFGGSPTPSLTISVPALRAFSNSGVGSVKISGVHGDSFSLENSGVGSIVASGKVESVKISNAGAGKIDAMGLLAHDATVDNDGVGKIVVFADGRLTATVNGVGSINYAGSPAAVEPSVNGVGRISAL